MQRFKKQLAILFSVVLAVTFIPVIPQAAETTSDDNITWELDGETLTISGTGEIKDSAFTDRDDIKKVIITDGITSIGARAFFDCDNLTSVTIQDSMKEIGMKAFADCDKLESIVLMN